MNRMRSTWYGWADVVVGLLILLLLSGGRIAAQGRSAPAADAAGTVPTTTVFVDVAVVPMDREQVLEHQTVVIKGDRIVAMGSVAKVRVPTRTVRIDGRQKFLMPGLADMHVHSIGGLGYNPKTTARVLERDLFSYVANGVTTVRIVDYWSDTLVLQARARAAAGASWSPQIYASGRWRSDSTKSIAENLRAYRAAGYDFIKLHGESGAVVDSLAAVARQLDIPFMGHVGQDDSLAHALAVRYASIEHLTGYPGGLGTLDTGATADSTRIPALAVATQRAGVWNTPTQAMYETWCRTYLWRLDPEAFRLEARFAPESFLPLPADSAALAESAASPDVALSWCDGKDTRLRRQVRRQVIKALQDAGAGLLVGTDSPLIVPGFGVHRELQALVRAGLTPYQALLAGTRNVAAYFGTLDSAGTVAAGKRADLVLLGGNPLADIRQTMTPIGVMVGGRWLSKEAIDQRVATYPAQPYLKD